VQINIFLNFTSFKFFYDRRYHHGQFYFNRSNARDVVFTSVVMYVGVQDYLNRTIMSNLFYP